MVNRLLALLFAMSIAIAPTVYASGHGDEEPAEGEGGEVVPVEPEIGYYTIAPDFTTNVAALNPREKLHYIRVKMSLMLSDSNDSALIADMEPLIKDTVINILGSKDFTEIASNEGREKIRVECRDKLINLLQEKVGHPIIQDALFLNYMFQ